MSPIERKLLADMAVAKTEVYMWMATWLDCNGEVTVGELADECAYGLLGYGQWGDVPELTQDELTDIAIDAIKHFVATPTGPEWDHGEQ